VVTSPSDIKVRSSDGSVFIAGLSHNEIGQFDPQTQSLRRWPLALDIESGGPFSLGIDDVGGVFFTAYNSVGSLIGRLDTTSGTITAWKVPDSIGDATRLTVAPGGRVFFTDNGGGFTLASLDVGTGTFVAWSLTAQPVFAILSTRLATYSFKSSRRRSWASRGCPRRVDASRSGTLRVLSTRT
jgi:streptogramin lyase